VLAVVGQEFWRGVRARQAMSHDSVPRALVSLVRRNRRRYGGYLVHAGIAVLFVGIAASSAFQHARDVRLLPGQRTTVGGYDVKYVRATGKIDVAGNGRLQKIDLGADLQVSKGGETRALHTERDYFPSSDGTLGAVSRYFEGESTSEVGLRSGLRRDLWTAINPDLGPLDKLIERGDRVFKLASALPAQTRAAALGETLTRLVARYRDDPPPATFRVLVSPLVTWIWLGALIVFAGGIIAIWPPPSGAVRRAPAPYAARLARELEGA
jgi:cytochrome c-type biogenesis protein CcmF